MNLILQIRSIKMGNLVNVLQICFPHVSALATSSDVILVVIQVPKIRVFSVFEMSKTPFIVLMKSLVEKD